MTRVIRTTDIDTFLNEEEELPELLQNEEIQPQNNEEDEDEPLWDEVDATEIKKESDEKRKLSDPKEIIEADDAIIVVEVEDVQKDLS